MTARPTTFRLSTTAILTLLLLTLMVAAGVISASWGFAFGRRALMGVTQPDLNGNWNNTGKQQSGATTIQPRGKMALLNEKQLITGVEAKLKVVGTGRGSDQSKGAAQATSSPKAAAEGSLPQASSNQGITLEVRSVRREGRNLVLGVQLQNSSDQAVRFLYSLLQVTDDQGQSLKARAEDLPGELPPNSQSYEGIVKVPASSVENAKTLSIRLTDYPEQRLRLAVDNIPIAAETRTP
ncbi:hypothetical protein [Leptolyngbya sp. FACHB-261]|uniref:hypothetical protein n=1 Tax=Leptolyngbya sp. FACHB-261 TaxID=2692806 RepID=UPI001686DFD2|nr:hypothetical protein [Leptolyngbya sp. FACHB-261]MBD2101354.1 hypothetical protein [Leptolyngbya sp. FACHB-261]